jgi:hypothetical protein
MKLQLGVGVYMFVCLIPSRDEMDGCDLLGRCSSGSEFLVILSIWYRENGNAGRHGVDVGGQGIV